MIPRRLKKMIVRTESTKFMYQICFPSRPMAKELMTMFAENHFALLGAASLQSVQGGAYHAADVKVGGIGALVLRHTLDTSLLDVEAASQTLGPCVEGVAILEALARNSAVVVDVRGSLVGRNIAHASLGGVLLYITVEDAHHGGGGGSDE